MAVGIDELKRLALSLPGVEEGESYGTLAFHVRKKFLGRLREDGETFALKCEMDERDFLIDVDPAVFFTLDHYRGYAYVLIRLPKVEPDQLLALIERAWRREAPKRLVAMRES